MSGRKLAQLALDRLLLGLTFLIWNTQMILTRLKIAIAGLASLVLVSCAQTPATISEPEPIGDFKLGHLVVFAKNAQMGPLSREATPEELEAALRAELEPRLVPLKGTKFYNVAISVDAFILAVPGIPIVASPPSGIVVSLNVWDDKQGTLVFEEHKRFTVAEKFNAKSFFGSGLTQSREQQIAALANVVVEQIDTFMLANADKFIDPDKDASDT